MVDFAKERQLVQWRLKSLRRRPQRDWGQNFLLDHEVVEQISAAVGLEVRPPVKTILEIGPGLGILTAGLLQLIKSQPKQSQPTPSESDYPLKLIVVERDHTLATGLKKQWRRERQLAVIENDIVRFNRAEYLVDGQYLLAANLPFQVTNFVLQTYLTQSPRPALLVLMIQREVAERLLAKAGDSARSLLSVVVEYYAQAKQVLEVPRSSFWPEPKVEATVVALKIKRPVTPADTAFFKLVKIGFSQRRKTIKNSLGSVLGAAKAEELLRGAKLNLTRRAQDLTLTDWQKLFSLYSGSGN